MSDSPNTPGLKRFVELWAAAISQMMASLGVGSPAARAADAISAPAPTAEEFEKLVCLRFTGSGAVSRRRKPEDHVSHERWLVSCADFITLLFAFFVVLYASSQVDKRPLPPLPLPPLPLPPRRHTPLPPANSAAAHPSP